MFQERKRTEKDGNNSSTVVVVSIVVVLYSATDPRKYLTARYLSHAVRASACLPAFWAKQAKRKTPLASSPTSSSSASSPPPIDTCVIRRGNTLLQSYRTAEKCITLLGDLLVIAPYPPHVSSRRILLRRTEVVVDFSVSCRLYSFRAR